MVASGDPPNQGLKTQLKAALNDSSLSEEGFETSKVIALIDVLLQEGDSTSGSVTSHTFPSRKKLVKMIKTCYQFVIKNKAGKEVMWFVDMKKKGRVAKGKAPFKPDVTIWCSDNDLVALATGEMNPQKLYAANRIKVRGNLDKALKVERIISHERDKILLAGQEPSPSSVSLSKSIAGSRSSKL
ncbi:hypothetical protein PGT21_024742 [Puccinia graminis f. sp. tritici]|uniref:SCP2 domain-containing protein n=2 Tax=Puccinia graminis f. sp. tritici TaxID=56615 RepID=E3KX42_PUCGT|nr:uncharacterized protein PGTG_14151 [Puccinia graminis f. sp. tritici CRL 75-36-700-3]EFP88812.1 hypothetical protein PGTG_14151 [Puccinia graminis f. sp. tritici CRL 75-36-700-3]KAA1096637.1 hypothetical protein PGT21_023517 [Puccinia graminis f. sp. tritici]KAA1113197.1 hypothetical protein PGT21_024742 [Puccinia graminis f. sp. tritici]KAA1131798.1 hypothetical protein PGTUg99_026162 [Puccinia graminis f. sp. tritici]